VSSTTAGAVPAESTSFTTHYGRMASTAALYQAAAEPSSRAESLQSGNRHQEVVLPRTDAATEIDTQTDRQTDRQAQSDIAAGRTAGPTDLLAPSARAALLAFTEPYLGHPPRQNPYCQ